MLLMIDNYDSFVYNLVRYFNELGEELVIYRNDEITIDKIKEMNISGIVISPGPKNPKEAGISLEILEKLKGVKPILGICLGHQCIGEYFGGEIIKGEKPMHGKISEVTHSGEGIFKEVKNPLKVTRYHSLEINRENSPKDLIVTAKTKDGVIMGVSHKNYPVYGVQFHPEAELTEDGHKILNNFLSICKEGANT